MGGINLFSSSDKGAFLNSANLSVQLQFVILKKEIGRKKQKLSIVIQRVYKYLRRTAQKTMVDVATIVLFRG